MVLEYASGTKLNNFGGNLESRLLFNGQIEFQEETIVNWLCQICLGLKHLHERGIIHRDIKTQNVFLNSKNRIKIGDLGISKELKGHKDYTKSFVGTPYYLPPEVIGGRYLLCQFSSYTNKFDMWSLGVLLYELCNRTVPFPGTSFNDVASNILSGEYKPISPSYSKELKSIIMSLLCSNPDLRPSAFDILNLKFSRIAINKFLSQENKGELHKTKVKHVHFEEKTEKKKNLETGFE
jgi:NIMA (never in mitosis gene a)-related kinase